MKQLRMKINHIDKEMALLFNERLKVVEMIKRHKEKHHLPIEDKEREKALLKENLKHVDAQFHLFYETFFAMILTLSKAVQK